MATYPVFPNLPKVGLVQIVNADASALKTLITGGTNGSKVYGITAATDDTVARVIRFGITLSSVFYLIGSLTVPIGAGIGGVASSNLFGNVASLPMDNDGNRFLFLPSASYALQVMSETTVTSGKTVHLSAPYADF